MAEKFDYLLTLGADADAIVEEVESKIKEAKASVKNQVLTISNVKIDDKGVLNNFIKELQSLAKSNAIKLDIDFSSFTQYQDNIESMQRMIDALNKTQIKNNITANLDREITVTKKDLASLTDQIDAYWEKIYRKGNTTKEGFGKEFYKGNQLYTKYISNIKEVQNLLSGKKIIDLDEKEIVTVYTYLVEIEKIHARLNASNRTLKDKTKLFDLSAGDFNYKSLITEAEKQMENFRRKFTTELMTYQKDQASALLNPLVESLKQAQEIAKNINKADSTIKLIDEEQVKSSSNEVTKLINKVKELEENKKKLSSKIEGLESKIPLDMSNLTEKDSMRLEEINRLKDEFTDLDRQIFKINSTIEVYKKLNLDGEIGSSILSVKELNKNLDEETLSLKDVQKELKKYGNIYKDLSFDEVINKMKEFNTQFDKLKAEGKNKIGNAEFTSLKNEIGSLYKYAIENKYDLSGLGSFNAIAKTFSNGLKIDEEAITKLQNQEKWHQHIIDRIQEEIRLKEKSVNVSQNTISQEQEQKHEHETVARESVSDQIVLDQSKNVLELIEQAKTLNALLADMKEQLGSLTGKPFEEMQVKIFNVNNELNDTLVKIENLKEKTQKDIEVKFKVDNSSLNNVEKIKQDSLEDKLEKLGLTKENALAMAQDITDKIAIDEKTGIYTETDNLIQTVTEYHDKIKDTNAYIQKGNDLIEERAILLKQGLQVGEEYVMSDATGKVDIGNGIKKHNADSVLHTHVFSDEVNNLRFSDADIKELVDGTVKKALLLCGNEIATLDMTNVDAGDFESLRNDILGAYTAVFARFGTEIKDGKLVDITSLPPDIQNQAADIVNNLVRNIIQNYGGDLVFDKIVDNDFEANDDVRLPKIEASEMEIVQKYIDAITSDKPAENIITLQKQFGVLKTSIQDVQKETNEISKSISPSQEFDNDIQRNLVSLENYKNTIKEIDKLKLEPETEETKAKIEELTELSKYFLKNISIIRSEVGGEISIASMKDGFGRFNIGLRERYDSDKLSELYDIGNENIGLKYSSIKSEFSGIDDEISRIEQSSESLRLSLTQTTQNSEKYVKNLKRQLMIMASAQEDLKTEKNPRWIEGFNRDIEKAISKFSELERFKEKFTTGSSAKSFINSDEWNEFLSTLPQAKAYLEFIGYEFKEISKVNQTPLSSPTLFEDSSGQLSFIEQTEKAVDLIEEESGQMAMFENIAEKATDSAIEGQKTLNDYLDKNIEGQMTLNDLMDKQKSSSEDTFDTGTESLEMKEVAVSTDEAVQAKKDFVAANEGVQDSVDGSKFKLQLEAELMESLAKNAREAADAKKEFVEANKQVQDSVDKTSDSSDSEEKRPKKQKRSKKSSDTSDISENEKAINETAKAYEDLTKKVEAYLKLKAKETNGKLSETDLRDLKEFEVEFENIIATQKKLKDVTGEVAEELTEAQKKFNDEVSKYKEYSSDDYVKNTNKQLRSLADATGKIPAYKDEINKIHGKLKELTDLFPIDLTNQAEIDQFKDARAEIDKMIKSLSGDAFKSMTSEADTLSSRISKILKQNTAMPKDLRNQFESLRDKIDETRNSAEGINKVKYDKLKGELARLESEFAKTGKTGASMLDKLSRKAKDFIAYIFTYVSFQDAIQVVKQGYEYVKEIDKQMIELEKVSDMSDARLAQSFDNSIESAKDLGSTISDVISATADWSRLGYDADAAEELAEVATIYKNVGDGIDIGTANESLISTLQGFKMEASEAMKIVDAFNEVANRMPIDSAGIGEALQRSAASFNAANTDLNSAISLITATNAVVQDPTRVGNMWKTVSMRIRGATAELEEAGLETEGMVESASQLRDLIKSMTGFDIMLDNDTYKNMREIVVGIGKEWDKLKDVDQAALLEKLAGKTQANALAAALDNYKMIEESYEIAQESAGSAMKEQEKWEEGLEAKTNKLKASLEELSTVFLDSDFLGGAIDAGRTFIEVLTGIIDKVGTIPTLLATAAGGFGLYKLAKGDGRPKKFGLIKIYFRYEYAVSNDTTHGYMSFRHCSY